MEERKEIIERKLIQEKKEKAFNRKKEGILQTDKKKEDIERTKERKKERKPQKWKQINK